MSILQGDPITQLAFSVYENKGVFAVLLGSGLSRSAEIPTGWEITLDLVRRVATAQGVEEQADWAKWYRDTAGQDPKYSDLLREIARSPDERRAVLHRYIEPDEEDRQAGRKIPTKAHVAIAKMVRAGFVRVIVTTNFDRLMENALREEGVEPTVVASADGLAGAEPLTHSRCYLLKLHGDYKDARILNTDEELSAYPKSYNRLLDRIFDEHGLIICGWSSDWDHALRAALIRAPNRRYATYWATRGDLSPRAQELAAHRTATTISITGADDFFARVLQRVETLERTQRQNPQSVELLVNSAKRFLAKPEHRIQLDEVVEQETARLLDVLDGSAFAPHLAWSEDAFRSRVSLYESQTEALARMAGVMGRWGDGTELSTVLDVLQSISHHAGKVGNGVTVWLNLRSYPAVLIFTAYGIGLTRAGRWEALLRLLNAAITVGHRDPERIVSTLFLACWSGDDQRLWQHLEGLDRHKTPLSDHLCAVMSTWASSFAGNAGDFELLFERFELLASLAHFQTNDEATLEQAAAAPHRDVLAYMPMGRAGWHQVGARALQAELEDEARLAALLAAGFAKGRRSLLKLFQQNFGRYASRMSW